MEPRKTSIIGDGGFGMAWALVLAQAGHNVTVWTTLERVLKYESQGYCSKYTWLEQYPTPPNLTYKPLIYPPAQFAEGELVFLAPPTDKLLEAIESAVKPRFGRPSPCAGVVTLVKGLYKGATPNSLLKDCFPGVKSAHITGAAFSEDLVKAIRDGKKVHMVVASEHSDFLEELDEVLLPLSFMPVWSHDPNSVQLLFAMRPLVSFMKGLAAGFISCHPEHEVLWPIIQAKMLIEGEVIASVLGAKDATVAYNPVRTVLIADDELCTTAKSRNFASAYAAGQGGALPTGDSKKGVVEAVNTIGRIYTELCMRMDSTQDPEMMLRGLVPYYMETHSYLFRGKPLDDCAKAILDRVAIRYRAPKL